MNARISTLVLTLGLLCAACVFFSAPAAAARGLATGLLAGDPHYGAEAGLAFERTRAAGATTIRIDLTWRDVAPGGDTRPAGFDPTNPADAAYNWSVIDGLVRLSVANGLEPVITIQNAPEWAERSGGGRAGTNNPDPAELGRFAQAAARRYSGSFAGLPRVRGWEVWNEVNGSFFFFPQQQKGRPTSPDSYRQMINEVAAAVHGVHRDNLVVAGALFPFEVERPGLTAIGPLPFMRSLLCMTTKLRPRRGCRGRARFDVWSHHPYTSGGPTHQVSNPNNVSVAQLPRMRRLLNAAARFKRIVHRRPVQFWVTEFSWDSNPPDPKGVPSRLHARWTAEALFRMWSAGVSLVTWFQLRDDADSGRAHSKVFESGLYLRCATGLGCDTAKPALTAFRFPFVAFRARTRRASVWGRTPGGVPAKVVVEQATRSGWRTLAKVRANRRGIFQRRVRTRSGRPLRARLPDGTTALPFSLKRPRDRTLNPFG
jgi:hypothetical protein